MREYDIEVYNYAGLQRVIKDAQEIKFSTHYGSNGGGYGYLRFSASRRAGQRYHDIGFGYRVILRKALKVVFDGMIREITETSDADSPKISVSCLGWAIVAQDVAEMRRAFCDRNLSKWTPNGEIPAGAYRPDKFSSGTGDTSLVMAATSRAVSAWDYIELVYDFFPFETFERIKCTILMSLGSGIVFDAEVLYTARNFIIYTADTGEGGLSVGDQLSNDTRSETATITYLDTSGNRIGLDKYLENWVISDAISSDGFTATISIKETSGDYIRYTNDSGEDRLSVGMTLINNTGNLTADILAVDTSGPYGNVITIDGNLPSWQVTDEITAVGPLFSGDISVVSGQDITYIEDYGEDNIATGNLLVNMTKSDIVIVSAVNTTTNIITVTGDITAWEVNDNVVVNATLFSATVSGKSGVTITYSGEIGERIVDSDTGWVVYNITRDSVATLATWDTASSQFDVTDSGDITSWVNTDELAIYTPFRVTISDENDAAIWPVSDWRLGAVALSGVAVDGLTTSSPNRVRIIFQNYVAGTGGPSSFVRISDPKVYSTELDVTMTEIAKYSLSEMSTLGISASEYWISEITKIIEPAVFDTMTHKDALSEVAQYGDGLGNEIAWGMKLNDSMSFYTELFPTGTKYMLKASQGKTNVIVSADIADSQQRIRGLYANKVGEEEEVDWINDDTKYFGTYYISRTETLPNIDNPTDATTFLTEKLGEVSTPSISSKYESAEIFDVHGNHIPFDEVVADGSYIEIENFRSALTGETVSSLSANWARDRLMAVEIDIDSRSISLIPGKAKKTFEKYMAELARIAGV